MRIGFDGKRATHNMSGLGNYSRSIINAVARVSAGDDLYIYSPGIQNHERLNDLKSAGNIYFKTPGTPYNKFPALWRSAGIISDLKKDKVEVYHGLSHELPFGIKNSGIKSIVTIHDLIFLKFKDLHGYFDQKIHTLKVKHACNAADLVIAISNQTKNDLIELLNVPEQKIKVIYQPCNNIFSEIQSEGELNSTKKKFNLPVDFILNVGTIEKRKNLELLIKAASLIKDQKIYFVIVGKKTSYFDSISKLLGRLNLAKRFIFIEEISLIELACLYKLSKLLVYPSLYEGFGLPVLEGISSGTAVITTGGGCMQEAGGDGAIYISPYDEIMLSEKINFLLQDLYARETLVNNGLVHAKKFNPESIGNQLKSIYHSI